MKASDKPEISKKWWTSEKPADAKCADLEKSLGAAEKSLADANKKGDKESIDTCLAALDDLNSVVDKTIKKELDKKKHKDVITVLEKYGKLIESEKERLTKLLEKLGEHGGEGKEDDEEDEAKVFQPEYLYKMTKLLRSTGKPLNFGFGLNSQNPAASKLVMTRKGKPDRLYKALKKTGDFANRLITYGIAVPDAQDGKTLVFQLAESAGEPPQIQKLGRKYLRSDKNLKFRKLKLVLPGGQTLEDTEPDEEDAAVASSTAGNGRSQSPPDKEAFRKEFEQLKRRLDGLMSAAQTRA